MISTGGTIAESVEALLKAGARSDVTIAATHPLLLSGAEEKLAAPAIRQVVVTDTIPVAARSWPSLRVVSVAPLIATVLQRSLADGSISELLRTGAERGQ